MLEGGEGEGGVTVVATTGAVGSGAVLWPFEHQTTIWRRRLLVLLLAQEEGSQKRKKGDESSRFLLDA